MPVLDSGPILVIDNARAVIAIWGLEPNTKLISNRDADKLCERVPDAEAIIGQRRADSSEEVQLEVDETGRAMNHTLPSKLAQEPDTAFPYGTIHAEFPASSLAAAALRTVQGEIAEEDLDGRGLDVGPPHIALRYGIQGDDISAIEALLGTQNPIAVTLGPTSSFPPSATRDVAVVVTVDSPELHALYQRLGEVTEFADPIHEYEPHVTVAYEAQGC